MKCPVCKDRLHIDVDAADGFCQDFRECGSCGAAWTFSGGTRIMIRGAKETFVPPVIEKHTKYSSCDDEYVAEDARVWFS